MAFEGILAAPAPTLASRQMVRFTTSTHRGTLDRGSPQGRVCSLAFDPESTLVVIALDNGQTFSLPVVYNGRPRPGFYTMRRVAADAPDGRAFVPDRSMGGTPNRDGYVIAFDAPTRASLANVNEFQVVIGPVPARRSLPRNPILEPYSRHPSTASLDAGALPRDAGTSVIDYASPDAGVSPTDIERAPTTPGTDDRGTDERGLGGGDGRDVGAASPVTLKITWHGNFGADLSARVRVDGVTQDRRPKYIPLAETIVEDPDKQGGKAGDRLPPVVFTVARYKRYRIMIDPLNQPPDDRYKTTLIQTKEIPNTSNEFLVDAELRVQRENTQNVEDTWDWTKIDQAKAKLLVPVSLFGRPVKVHAYIVPRVNITNGLFLTMPASVRQEISESIYSLGHQVLRTTTRGRFSNHSVGVAFDINANDETKQDDHFIAKNMQLLDHVIQPIVRLDPRFAAFDIRHAKGLDQLRASWAFNERFPIYIAALLGRIRDVVNLEQYTTQITKQSASSSVAYHSSLRDQIVKDLSSSSNKKRFGYISKGQKKNSDSKKRHTLILYNWNVLFTWVLGANVKDRFTKKTKRAVGMIPLHPKLLEIMLAAGWSWGGDWLREKDYMHFEDAGAKDMLKRGSK